MTIDTIDKLCCPYDRADLKLTAIRNTPGGAVEEGYLTCRKCERVYPIIRGIPIMNPDEYREFDLEKPILEQWKSSRLESKR